MTTTRISEIQHAHNALFDPGSVIELRAPGDYGTCFGYFNDPEKLAENAAKLDDQGCDVYWTINPVVDSLLARACNRTKKANKRTSSTSDDLVEHRRRLVIDIDPVRPSGISSTDEEKSKAYERAREVAAYLKKLGWPTPVFADSGNGYHLIYRIELPNDKVSRDLVQKILEGLDLKFSDDAVKIDTTMFNAARICKVYGTRAKKGDDTPDRPHRDAKLLYIPDEVETISETQLREVAELAPEDPPRTFGRNGQGGFDIERFIEENGIAIRKEGSWKDGGRKWELEVCPFNSEHTDGSGYILQFPSGALAAGCHHNSCQGKKWRDLREAFEPGAYDYPTFSGPNGDGWLSSSSNPEYISDDDDNNGLDIVRFSELGEPKERKYLIEDVCAKGHSLVAFGAGGVAKSLAMLLAGIAIAGGEQEWLGLAIKEHGSALYLDFELDAEEQHRRVRDLCAGLQRPIPEQLAYLSAVGMPTETVFSHALKFCKQAGVVAVIIDSMGLAMQGDMQHAKDVLAFHREYIDPFRQLGITPLIVDHEGKLQAGERHQDKSPFGSAYKAWAARSVLQFQAVEHDRENATLDIRVRHTKTNFGPKLEPFGVRFTFRYHNVTVEPFELPDSELSTEDSVPAKERIVGVLSAGSATIKEIQDTTGLAYGTVRNCLSELMQETAPRVGVEGRQGRSNVYCLLSSSSENPKDDNHDDNEEQSSFAWSERF